MVTTAKTISESMEAEADRLHFEVVKLRTFAAVLRGEADQDIDGFVEKSLSIAKPTRSGK